MFENAREEIDEFGKNFQLEMKDDEELEQQEKKRVYWKDLIKREEERLEKMQEEAEAEKLKFGDKDDEDGKVKDIGSVNPIADFLNIIKDRKVDRVNEGITLMQKMIEKFINASLKGDLFEKAIECVKELRNACVTEDEAPNFNRFAYRIRNQYNKGDQQSNFFLRLVKERITLITKDESRLSSLVDQFEANEFLDIGDDELHEDDAGKAKEAKGTKDDLADQIE